MLDPNNVLSVMHSNFTQRRSLTQGASIILPKLDQTGRQPPSTGHTPTGYSTGHWPPLTPSYGKKCFISGNLLLQKVYCK